MSQDKWYRRAIRLSRWWLKMWIRTRKLPSELPLIFLLGSARSGTTWLSKSLSKSDRVRSFYEEPLTKVMPRLWLSVLPDRMAAKYTPILGRWNPLRLIYGVFSSRETPSGLFEEGFYHLINPDASHVLIKEVHGLLAAEAMVKHFDAKFILINRNPLAIVDSLIVAQTVDTVYFVHEYQYMKNRQFLDTYFANTKEQILLTFSYIDQIASRDLRIISEKLFALYLLRHFFQRIAERYPQKVILKDYEQVIMNPDQEVSHLADFVGLPLQEDAHIFEKDNHKEHHYSTARDTRSQLNKPLKKIHHYLPALLEIFSQERLSVLEGFVEPYQNQIPEGI